MLRHEMKVGETFLSEFSLTFLEIAGAHEGPALALVAGIHGDELSSVGGLVKFLNFVSAWPVHKLNGRIVALPFANPLALMQMDRGVRLNRAVEWENLNRNFPGDSRGSLTERIARRITGFLKSYSPALVVDIHTMGSRALPLVIIDRIKMGPDFEERLWSCARNFGVGVVYDLPTAKYEKEKLSASLTGKMLQDGIPSFTVEVPGGLFSQSEAEDIVYKGLINMVYALGIASSLNFSVQAHETKWQVGVGKYCRFSGPRAKRAGFFVPAKELTGSEIESGQVIGIIYNRRLEPVEFVTAPAEGLVSSIIDAAIVNAGDELCEMLVLEEK